MARGLYPYRRATGLAPMAVLAHHSVGTLVDRVAEVQAKQPGHLKPADVFDPPLADTAVVRFLGCFETREGALYALDGHRPAYVEPFGDWWVAYAMGGARR